MNERPALRTYILGFACSIFLTVTAYIMAAGHALPTNRLLLALGALALTQLVVQLVCFLHLSPRSQDRWKNLVFAFMLIVVLIVVAGSLWIMKNLDYHMTPQQINTYMNSQDGL